MPSTKNYYDDEVKEDAMDEGCSRHWAHNKCIHFGLKPEGERPFKWLRVRKKNNIKINLTDIECEGTSGGL